MSEDLNRIDERPGTSVLAKASHPTTNRTRTALILSALLTLLVLVWSTWDHGRTRLERERALAVQATEAAAAELARRLESIDRQLTGFTNQEHALLDALLATPDAADASDNFWSVVQREFPQATAALILDGRGSPVAELGDGSSEDNALFLHRFARGDVQPARFSRHEGVINANFTSSWLHDGEPEGTLLLRLSYEALRPPESISTPLGHSLHLVPGPSTTPTQAEIPVQGPARLAVLAQAPAGDTGWILIDRLDADYLSEILRDRLMLGLGLGAGLLLATVALYRWVQSHNRMALDERSELYASRSKLQAILSTTTDGIILTGPNGRIELFNPAAEMMFGYLSEEVLKTDAFRLLPDFFSSQGALSLLRQQNGGPAPPFVQETRARRQDGKEFPVRIWISSVRFDDKPHRLVVVQDLTEHERNEEHLVFLQQHDLLTGLLNRREFERRLIETCADSQCDQDKPHVLCHIDVDQFKLINDTCGHEAGDELLKQLATLIKAKLDEAEIIGRSGGDEFVALFRNRTAEEAREICDGLSQTVRNFLFTWSDQSFDVAVSIGLAEFTPQSEGPSSALSKADVACHMAKTHGRDRIHIYHEGDVELIRHHGDMHLVSTISQALSDGRFHLYAQPITPVAATGSKRRRFEILVRMVDESGTAMIPDQFIPAAERYILMPAVDRWIINRLFALQAENLRTWHSAEPDSFLFAVNLSGTSIADEGFLHYLKRQFAEWNVPHRSICFEITETAAVGDLKHARAFMLELSALGCTFALDDFGTGLSYYRYLKELPVDYLKIDGSFVRDMSEDPVSYALVESITQVGHVLGLKIIAEWTEDKSTLLQLRALNVDFAQGYAIGAPLPVCDLTLADTTSPPAREDTHDDRRHSPHRSRRSAARPARSPAAEGPGSTGLEP